jgi:hypothetical protein
MDIIHDSSAITMMRILTMPIEQPPLMTLVYLLSPLYVNVQTLALVSIHSRRSAKTTQELDSSCF